MEESAPGYDAIDADTNGSECMAALRSTEVRSRGIFCFFVEDVIVRDTRINC